MSSDEPNTVNDTLTQLIDQWCERRDLKSLATLLPTYTSNSGMTDDWAGVLQALLDLRSRARLPEAEQVEVELLIPIVERMVFR